MGLGTAGLGERGLGFPFLAQSGPWGALRLWPLDPTPPTPPRSWWSSPVAKGRHHRVPAGGERRAFASRDLSRRGVGEDRRNNSKKKNVSPEAEYKKNKK